MHALIPTVFSLFFLPLSFSPFFLLLVAYYSLAVGCFSPLSIFPFESPSPQVPLSLNASLRFLLLSYHGFLPLGASPISSMATSAFYSELIQWDFSLLPLEFHQLFLACFEHSFSTTHQPIGCPATTSTHNTIPATNTFCYSLFLFIVLLHINFHTYPLYKRIWAFVCQIMLTGSKGPQAQFALICQSHSAEELYSATNLYSAANL